MTFDEKTKELIMALGTLSKKKKIKWISVADYMQTEMNRSLKKHLIECNKYAYSFINNFTVDEYESLCTEYKDGMVYLFKNVNRKKEFYQLGLQTNTVASIVLFNDESSFQKELNDLIEKIGISQEPVDQYMQAIIDEANEN